MPKWEIMAGTVPKGVLFQEGRNLKEKKKIPRPQRKMPKISEVLDLNAFEEAVVNSILTKYVQKRIELQILELPKDQTNEAMEKIAKDQTRELEQGLPKEKFEAYLELQKHGFNSKKIRKKKKKKKKT